MEVILTKEELREVFTKFITTKGVWTEYFSCILEATDWDHDGKIDLLFEEDPHKWIEFAFSWSDAPSSWNIWNDIDEEWRKILELNGSYEE